MVKRNQSGVILELELEFQNGAVSVQSEYNMRAILGCGITNINLLDGSSVEMSILPSAYISIQAKGDGTYAVLWRWLRSWHWHEPEWGTKALRAGL